MERLAVFGVVCLAYSPFTKASQVIVILSSRSFHSKGPQRGHLNSESLKYRCRLKEMQFIHLLQCRCFEIAIQKGWEILFSFSFSPHPHATHTLQRSQISLIFPYYNKFECSHSEQLQDMNLPLMLLGAPHLSLQDTAPNFANQKSVTHCLPKRCSAVHLGRAVMYIAHTPFSSVDCPCSFA